MELKYIIEEQDLNKTINEILTNRFHFSNRLFTKLIKNKKVLLNATPCDTRAYAEINDEIAIKFDISEDNSNIIASKMDIDIIYEDDWLLVINKPYGIPIHPSRMHFTDSLSNGVKYYFDFLNLSKKIRAVNRLDIDTSGLVVFAKCEYIQEEFIRQMSKNIFKKTYLCLIEGSLENSFGCINLPIARKEGSIIERCIKTEGTPSITDYKVIENYEKYSYVECTLKTGRTHQIRVHMSAIGHPILGDTLYGNTSNLIKRQALHSYKIECIHPISKRPLTFKANIPKDIKSLLV